MYRNFLPKIYVLVCIFFIQLLCIQTVKSQPNFIQDSLENYIKQGMKDWQIPGLSIVIVKDGKIITMKGYGVKDINGTDTVDSNTLFMIASNTKLFTGTALAQLEYRKKLSLDDKISKYFANFSLYEKNSTEMVTIKDMLTHRIGTKTFQGDFTFFNGNASRNSIIYKMRYLKPTGIFRQDYGYCNSCYLTAGEVIPEVTGQPWEVYIYDSIIMPLGMTQTLTLSKGITQIKNAAKPYTTAFTGNLTQVPYDTWDNLAPAASIVSNVNDLSHWLMMQLNNGKYNNQQIIPTAAILKTRDIAIAVSSRKSSIYPINFRGYGLGVFAADYNGKQMYWHTGGASGMVSNVCFVPEEKLGIAILTNNDNQNFFEALRYQILDAYLGVPYVNRSKQQLSNFLQAEQQTITQINALKQRIKNNQPSLILENYVGTYTNELYGKLIIEQKENHLTINFKGHDNLTATVKYLDNDEWVIEYNNPLFGIFPLQFDIDQKNVTSVNIKVNDYVEMDAYKFIKQ
jgi:CubicO group peptidase (beta-lactamase class C family)